MDELLKYGGKKFFCEWKKRKVNGLKMKFSTTKAFYNDSTRHLSFFGILV